MSYFDHSAISNSDLKKFMQNLGLTRELPVNLQAIFAFGTLFHKTILEPNLVTREEKESEDYVLAMKMQMTFWEDSLCRDFVMAHDFQREKEFYDTLEVGGMRIQARCKADGFRSSIRYFMELKGLKVSTDRAFQEALVAFDYDMGIVFYMLTAKADVAIIPAISKKNPKLMFKRIVKKHDEFYAGGEEKLIHCLNQLRQFSPEDVQLAA